MRGSIIMTVLVAVLSAACEPHIDLTTGLELVEVSTGWYDAGIVDGQNKLVPSISFKLKNISDRPLSTLQANVLFNRVGEDTEWGSSYVRVVGTEGLAPGAQSAPQSVQCPKGYTGSEPRAEMLANPEFVDARVRVMAKYGSAQWKPIGEFIVDRRLLDR